MSTETAKYSVAAHSVRITKYGYAIDPVKLLYPEIERQNSQQVSSDETQIGHQILRLIRGFWSQPGFPKGRAYQSSSVESTMFEFGKNPLFPHRRTFANRTTTVPAISKPERSKSSDTRKSNKKKISSTEDSKLETINVKNAYFSWIPKDKEHIYLLLSSLCEQMEKLFSQESRIITVSSPCTVLGDIHGNLSDLRTYEWSLWPKAPLCVTSNYLFLGDYVDRGDYSIECVLYLFCMKLIAPTRFYLLRGNHEVAAIQRQYTFSKECETKFGPLGGQLWKKFNHVFDLMPVAAIIDDQIFCAHGGIPRSTSDIRALAKEIPTPLDNPEIQCPAAWEILWNDPITESELIAMIEMDNAVVTQTSITQAQPTSDGNDTLPTTIRSMALASEALVNNSATTRDNNQDKTQSEKAKSSSRDSQASKSILNEADAILAREPPSVLSFYIRPDDQPPPGTQPARGDKKRSKRKDSKSKPTSGGTTSDEKDDSKNSDTLHTVPSDTSSIASTSPQQIMNDGFVANIKRGTAYMFSDQAIDNFLKVNKLSHVIRAHEVIPTGFAFHGDGRVITIFSSSKYCGLNNQAAGALVDRGQIKILRLDTDDAGE